MPYRPAIAAAMGTRQVVVQFCTQQPFCPGTASCSRSATAMVAYMQFEVNRSAPATTHSVRPCSRNGWVLA